MFTFDVKDRISIGKANWGFCWVILDLVIGLIVLMLDKKDQVFTSLVLTIPTVYGIFNVFGKKPV